jgi:hypothetical protein
MERPTEQELNVCMMATWPGAPIGSSVACVLKAELLFVTKELADALATLAGVRALVAESAHAGLANVDRVELGKVLGWNP